MGYTRNKEGDGKFIPWPCRVLCIEVVNKGC